MIKVGLVDSRTFRKYRKVFIKNKINTTGHSTLISN